MGKRGIQKFGDISLLHPCHLLIKLFFFPYAEKSSREIFLASSLPPNAARTAPNVAIVLSVLRWASEIPGKAFFLCLCVKL
ncbi:hypothetical protein AYK25_05735 [Thermoplasmatales archaeon SM1-50]|nr:MAG: hypothetical protein AYK25_05735 [Thermoplasmatales archaeon SM1-50]